MHSGVLKVRAVLMGEHVHARFWLAKVVNTTFETCGELRFRLEEWPAFRRLLEGGWLRGGYERVEIEEEGFPKRMIHEKH